MHLITELQNSWQKIKLIKLQGEIKNAQLNLDISTLFHE